MTAYDDDASAGTEATDMSLQHPDHDTASHREDALRPAPRPTSTPSDGRRLDPTRREAFGAWLDTDLDEVRMRTGAEAERTARGLSARAVTRGATVTFGAGAEQPGSAAGDRLLAHELAHVVQARNGVGTSPEPSRPGEVAEREAAAVADAWATGAPAPPVLSRSPAVARDVEDPDHPLPPPAPKVDAEVSLQPLDEWTPDVDPDDPAVLLVPPGTSREQIVHRLYGDAAHYGGFDLVSGGSIRLRTLDGVARDVVAMVRKAFEDRLPKDVRDVVDILVQRRIDGDEEWTLLHTTEWWSTRGDLTNSAGTSYFDAFLDLLDTHRLEEWGLFSNTTRPASEWLVIEAEEKKWAIHPLLGRRSTTHRKQIPEVDDDQVQGNTRITGPITAAPRPWNEVPRVVGGYTYRSGEDRFLISSEYQNTGSITVEKLLVTEDTAVRAEIALRNSPHRGARVMIPGGDGHFYGYSIDAPSFWKEDYVQPASPDSPRLQRFWWHYPGTVFIPGGGFQPDFPVGGTAEKAQRVALLTQALTGGLPALRGLDFDVLTMLTLDQRVTAVGLAAGSADSADLGLILRVVHTTPAAEFPTLEHRLSSNGSMEKILNTTESQGGLAVLGRVFTVKAVEAAEVPGEASATLPEFQVGLDSDGFYHHAYPKVSTQDSQLVGAGQLPASQGVGIGRERAGAGETAGTFRRSVVVLQPAIYRGGGSGLSGMMKNMGRGLIKTLIEDDGKEQGPFLPTQLVKVTSLGPQSESRVVTVLEAVGLLELSAKQVLTQVLATHIQGGVTLLAGMGLVRAFGPAFAEGMIGGTGVRGVASGLAEAAATEAGSTALVNAGLVAAMEFVERNRAALRSSPEGRAFLELYDITMLVWVGRDLTRLIVSGLVPRLASAAERVVALPGLARDAVLPLGDELKAFVRAIGRYRTPAEAAEAATAEGLTVVAGAPARGQGFLATLRVARGEVASERLMSRIAGTPVEATGKRIVNRLAALVERSESEAAAAASEAAQAQGKPAVARQAEEAQSAAAKRAKSAADAQFAVSQRAAQLRPDARDAFLAAVDRVVASRPNSLASLTDLLVAAAESRTPSSLLADVQRLVNRRGVSDEALAVLGRKVRQGRNVLDLAWLNRTSITDDALDFLGRDKRTNWDLYRRAAADPSLMRDFRTSARGVGAEMVGAAEADRLGTDVRRQVKMGSSEIDFDLLVAGRRHGFEIKGWARDTWADALDAAIKKINKKALTDAEREAVKKIDRMIDQLTDAQQATGQRPYLGLTDNLTEALRGRLRRVLEANGLGSTRLVELSESQIKHTAAGIGQQLGVL